MKKLIAAFLLIVPFCLLAQEKSSNPKISVSEPLFVLDGKILPSLVLDPKDSMRWVKPLELIDPTTIERMVVLKGIAAKEKYGEAGKNGAVEIILRRKQDQDLKH